MRQLSLHERCEVLFGHINEAIAVIDDFKAVWDNELLLEMFCYEFEEVIGTSFMDYFDIESIPAVIRIIETTVKTGKFSDAVVRVRTGSGDFISVRGRLSRIPIGDEMYYVCFVRKIEAFTNNPAVIFLENEVKHEIFTPLAVIRGYIGLLLSMSNDKEQTKYLKTMLRKCDRLENKFNEYWKK